MAERQGGNELFFAAGGMAGAAASAALRRVHSLADTAPAGRLFSSIATLTEMTLRIETSLVTASAAACRGDEPAANRELSGVMMQMEKLTVAASPTSRIGNSDYFRKRR